MSAILIVVSHLVEVVLVELADETREVAVLEMLGKNRLGESLVLHQCLDVANRFSSWVIILLVPQSFLHHHPTGRLVNTTGLPTSLVVRLASNR